ncbi:LOW QUALITY PROTEIN: uncharacterized protein LOC135201099 [Macrobrachium nipponense]|uniref:LOW QUALITY PROTEIN: uncharacterized protein LOC135201099 n=1 Tax=Macrobrachium nipponense TaxID=159736 RepID=UPI0030C7B490
MASLSHLVALATLLAAPGVLTQEEPLLVIPSISDATRDNAAQAGAAAFVRLWEHALEVDGQGPGPAVRVNFEAKTILAPGELAMSNLIPQDTQDPLYGDTEELRTLRRNLLKDHLVLDPIKPTDPNVTSEGGARALTFTGKAVHFRKNEKGELAVENVPVTEVKSLDDGTQLYILEDLLFDNRQKVNQIFLRRHADELAKPTGPPLDIPEESTDFIPSPQFGGPLGSQEFSGFAPIIAPPAPPPPAAPGVVRSRGSPPALPPGVFPPAPPPDAAIRSPPGPPAAPPSDFRPPAPPVAPTIRAPAPPPPGLLGPQPPASSRVSPPAPPAEGQGKSQRAKRQLDLPELDDPSSFDPMLQSGSSGDLDVIDFSQNSSPSRGGGYQKPSRFERLPTGVSPSGNNRPLSELSSIEQFATLFQLANSPDRSSIVRVLQEAGLVTMLGLLETSGLLQKLVSSEGSPYILLVPSQSAFSKLSRRELFELARGTDLSYHLIPLQGQALPEVNNDSTFVTLLGPQLRFNVYGGVTYANGVPVTRDDLTFSYGTIQVVDSVLKPPVGDLMSVLVNTGLPLSRITTLLTVVGDFEKGVYTLLAPPDSAISSKGYSWPGLLMQRALGKDLLEKHMLKGTWYSEGLLLHRTMTTLAGTSVTFRREADGTVTVNGVPVRSCNLSASNGVVHVVADVIPDSDLGSDPTAIPNPLISQTEAPVFESFASGGDIIPEAPVISGLYDLPGRDPFKELLPVKTKPGSASVSRRDGLPSPAVKTRLPDAAVAQTLSRGSQNVYSSPQTSNVIQPVANINHHNQNRPANAFSSGTIESCCQPVNFAFDSFLEMLDRTSEEHHRESGGLRPPAETQGSKLPSLYAGNFAHHPVSPLPLVRVAEPHILEIEQFYGTDGKEDAYNILQITTDPPYAKVVVDKRLGTPDFTVVLEPTPQPDTGSRFPSNGKSDVKAISRSQNSLNHTSVNKEGNFPDNVEATSQQSIPIVVVPDGPFVWRPENTISADERRRMNVVSLLQRLNLTKFAELVEISGLARTLHLDGPWTVFAPSNEAIEAIPRKALEEMIARPRFLRRVVSYHVAPGRFPSATAFRPGTHLPTLHSGYTLVLSYYTEGPLARWVAGGSVISDLDEEASNGVIHVLDQMLYAPYGHIIATMSLSPLLTIFSEILSKDPEMQAYLAGSIPVTVFAPEDDSLKNTTISEDPLVRREWILSHIVDGTWYTAGFSDTWPLVSLANSTLVTRVLQDPDKIAVNGIEITYSDITAANGVIQVIESPLLSPT